MPNPFEVLITNLNQLGFFGFLLPWIFIFAIVFAVLVKTKTLGEDRRISAIIALVFAFFVVGFGGPALGNFFVTIFGIAAAVIAGIFILILFMGMAGMSLDNIAKSKAVLVFFIAMAIVVFVVAAGAWSVQVDETVVGIILMLVVMGAAVVFIGYGGKKD